MSPIPGRPNKPRVPKQYRVRTVSEPHLWLHALDPLAPGCASTVRTEWREAESDATPFTSRIYLEQVLAQRARVPYEILIEDPPDAGTPT
jgi:hypothetical protein